MTRVLLLHQPTDGGVARHLTDLADGLAAQGHEVSLCGPGPPTGLPDSFPREQLDLGRAIGPADIAALRDYLRILRGVAPDVVHAHSSKAGAIARLGRARRPRTPVLYTPHGYAFAGHFSRELERSAYRQIERALAPAASRVVCVSEAEARLARSVGPAARVRVVHNGIDIPAAGPVDPAVAEIARSGPVLCALTLLRPGKGIETLIDAFVAVRERHPRVQLAIAGDGPDRGALEARARDAGLAESVHFLGPSADPLGVIRGANVFVHPSWAESFPYVILEAMAVGVPIVASDVGGVGEALSDRETGLLVPPRSAPALARALLETLEDPDAGARLAAAGRLKVQQSFTRAHMVDGIARVYDEVTRRSASAPAPLKH